jgi:hypothetical protein
MSDAEKVLSLIVLVGLATTLTLPKRQTANVINAFGGAFSGALGTAMGLGAGG